MRAVLLHRYGTPRQALSVGTLEKPSTPSGQEVLVRVQCGSPNMADVLIMQGYPYLARIAFGLLGPKFKALGNDFSGVVESVGEGVTKFKPGDRVFGNSMGNGWAEYAKVEQKRLFHIPAGYSFEEAAATPIGAYTALSAVHKIDLQRGHHVLVHGASGCVGIFAVQLCKAKGARVTAVCRGAHMDWVRALGADHVINYEKEDYVKTQKDLDGIIDMVANYSISENLAVLKPTAKYVMIGGAGNSNLMFALLKAALRAKVNSRVQMVTSQDAPTLMEELSEYIAQGSVRPAIRKTYSMDQAIEMMEDQMNRTYGGKLVLKIAE